MVVAPYAEPGRGAFVTLVRPSDGVIAINSTRHDGPGPAWIVDGWVRTCDLVAVGPRILIAEECLRKVDPGKGPDETMTWAGLPKAIEQPEPATT